MTSRYGYVCADAMFGRGRSSFATLTRSSERSSRWWHSTHVSPRSCPSLASGGRSTEPNSRTLSATASALSVGTSTSPIGQERVVKPEARRQAAILSILATSAAVVLAAAAHGADGRRYFWLCVTVGVLAGQALLQPWTRSTEMPRLYVLHWLMTVVVWGLIGGFIGETFNGARLLGRLQQERLTLDLFDTSPLQPLARWALPGPVHGVGRHQP